MDGAALDVWWMPCGLVQQDLFRLWNTKWMCFNCGLRFGLPGGIPDSDRCQRLSGTLCVLLPLLLTVFLHCSKQYLHYNPTFRLVPLLHYRRSVRVASLLLLLLTSVLLPAGRTLEFSPFSLPSPGRTHTHSHTFTFTFCHLADIHNTMV